MEEKVETGGKNGFGIPTPTLAEVFTGEMNLVKFAVLRILEPNGHKTI
jgi:hypothetical protein